MFMAYYTLNFLLLTECFYIFRNHYKILPGISIGTFSFWSFPFSPWILSAPPILHTDMSVHRWRSHIIPTLKIWLTSFSCMKVIIKLSFYSQSLYWIWILHILNIPSSSTTSSGCITKHISVTFSNALLLILLNGIPIWFSPYCIGNSNVTLNGIYFFYKSSSFASYCFLDKNSTPTKAWYL